MFGHGQVEGFAEKYGMEYFRPYWDEAPDPYLIERHQREIFPLLKQRDLFSGIEHFLLLNFHTGKHQVNEDVFAYINGNRDTRALVVYHNKFGSTQGWIHFSVGFLDKTTGRIESKLLHEGLNLSIQPGQFIVFKDHTSNLEYIRSGDEVRRSGLYFALDAYEHHVFTEFRVLDDNADSQFSQLNQYLGGRGVPSIDEALQALMLSPILKPFKALVNKEELQTLYQVHLESRQEKPNSVVLKEHKEKFLNLLAAISDYIHRQGELDPIARDNQRGLDAILKLLVFDDHFPFPGSAKYQQIVHYIKGGNNNQPVTWFTLFLWNDLRLLGRVLTADDDFAAISRSLLEEWGLVRVVRAELEQLNLNHEMIYRTETILRLIIQHQNWVFAVPENATYGLVNAWFADEEIRSFLNINRYREKLWFNKEAFEALMWWMMTIALIRLSADPTISHTERVGRLFIAFEHINKILEAKEHSEYQVEKLLVGLK